VSKNGREGKAGEKLTKVRKVKSDRSKVLWCTVEEYGDYT
jgi:hypothetical protein